MNPSTKENNTKINSIILITIMISIVAIVVTYFSPLGEKLLEIGLSNYLVFSGAQIALLIIISIIVYRVWAKKFSLEWELFNNPNIGCKKKLSIIVLYCLLIFILVGSIILIVNQLEIISVYIESTNTEMTPTPTIEEEIEPTLIGLKSPTPTIEIFSTPEILLSPTPMPTDVTEIQYPEILLGVFDLGEDCIQKEIIQRISELGFDFQLISFDILYTDLLEYDVLYLPSGWSCKINQVNEISGKLEGFLGYSKGILIGNPELSILPNYDIPFLPINIRFSKLQNIQEYDSFNTCAYSVGDCQTHWIINNLTKMDFPYPETIITFPENGDHWTLTRGVNSRYPSLVIGSNAINKYYVLLAGGEFSSEEKTISDELFIRILHWLAQKAPTGDDLEWYPYYP